MVSLDNSGEATEGIQLATWAASEKVDGNKNAAQSLVFVQENDIYFLKDAAAESAKIQRLTSNGHEGVIFNGVADWLYEGS